MSEIVDSILVVGAGPVGLTAALALRSHGLPVAVLEAEPADRIRPGSRALFVHRDSLSTLELLRPGLGTAVARHGVVWQSRRTLYHGRQVFAQRYPRHDPAVLPPFTSLRQVDTERFLMDACVTAGVTFHWDTRVTAVDITVDGVTLEDDDGRRFVSSYVIGADGARSAVRRTLGIELSGSRSTGSHVVVDVAMLDDEQPTERIFHYEHPGVGGRTVLQVPFTGGFQVDLQCRDEDPPEAFGGADAVGRWLPDVVGPTRAERILWVSTYHFLRKVATSFTDPQRRVLLVGEACHLFPPFGARGMNSGIADAAAAAEAIAAALQDPGRATTWVDRFATTRRDAALFNSRAAGAALAHLRPNPVLRTRQRLAARLAPMVPRCGAWLERSPYGPRRGPTATVGRY